MNKWVHIPENRYVKRKSFGQPASCPLPSLPWHAALPVKWEHCSRVPSMRVSLVFSPYCLPKLYLSFGLILNFDLKERQDKLEMEICKAHACPGFCAASQPMEHGSQSTGSGWGGRRLCRGWTHSAVLTGWKWRRTTDCPVLETAGQREETGPHKPETLPSGQVEKQFKGWREGALPWEWRRSYFTHEAQGSTCSCCQSFISLSRLA